MLYGSKRKHEYHKHICICYIGYRNSLLYIYNSPEFPSVKFQFGQEFSFPFVYFTLVFLYHFIHHSILFSFFLSFHKRGKGESRGSLGEPSSFTLYSSSSSFNL